MQLIPPACEPISLDEAKLFVKQDVSDDDLLIGAAIRAAREHAQAETQRQVVCARWRLDLDSFPGPSLMGVQYGKQFSLPPHAIVLPNGPLVQVVSIQYTDMGGTLQTLTAGTDYIVESTRDLARITPPFGRIWPIPLPQIGCVRVTWDAGDVTPITADAAADTITVPFWKALSVGDTVQFCNSGGALPAGLAAGATYYVKQVVSTGVYKLSATSGGAAIDLTDAGSGQSFLGIMPDGLLAWMRLRIGSLDLYRAEALALGRGRLEPLPFIDSLLNSSRIWMA